MTTLRSLNEYQEKELAQWLDLKDIKLEHHTMRILSDVVNMAQLFKDVDDKLVNMIHYTSHGNMKLKIHNWETFNIMVLRRTGLTLMRPTLELLASGDKNAIKFLLHHLICIERDGIPVRSPLSRRGSQKSLRHQDVGDKLKAHALFLEEKISVLERIVQEKDDHVKYLMGLVSKLLAQMSDNRMIEST